MKERIRIRSPLPGCSCGGPECPLVKALARAVGEVAMHERTRTLTMRRATIGNHEAARDA
jgi:hypothetical protein